MLRVSNDRQESMIEWFLMILTTVPIIYKDVVNGDIRVRWFAKRGFENQLQHVKIFYTIHYLHGIYSTLWLQNMVAKIQKYINAMIEIAKSENIIQVAAFKAKTLEIFV